MSEVYVIGAGMTRFGPQPEAGVHDLAFDAAWAALEEAGVEPGKVDIAFAGHAYQGPCFGQKVLMRGGLTGMPILNVENACASGASAVLGIVQAIRSGAAEIGIAIGAEKLSTPAGGFLPTVADDLDSSMGRVMPAAFAMQARLHMDRYGTTREQMAMVAVKNRRNALRNPRCHMQKEVTIEEVLAAPMIADPLTRLSCCPVSDGAAALVIASARAARKYNPRPVRIAASVLVSGLRTPHGIVDDKSEMSIRASRKAYEAAGLGPDDVDVCEMHDPFTIAEIIHYEDLGFCAPGEGGRFVEDGRSAIGGAVAVSPSGGLLAKGHPLGATGVAQIAELYWQLRGVAGGYQVPGARVGLAHTVGGGVSQLESGACGVHILVA
ncbi:MAG: thiolase family protein [Alphaproteobacteria bacterium]|nr:thiolase family protein [Alphaproteobacteria bacterium]